MTGRSAWLYWASGPIFLAAIVAVFWPSAKEADAERAVATRAAGISQPDAAALASAAASAERLTFLSREAAQEAAASDSPPTVVAVVAVGRRRIVYVGTGDTPQRVPIGGSVDGWTVVAAGDNYADFSRAGEVRRVRLFQGNVQAEVGATVSADVQPQGAALK